MSYNFLELCVIRALYEKNISKTVLSFNPKDYLRSNAILKARINNKYCDRCSGSHFFERTLDNDYWELFCSGCGNTIEEGFV